MPDLAGWLQEQLDHDERIAREATALEWVCASERDGKPGHWRGIKAWLVTAAVSADPLAAIQPVGDEIARCESARDTTHIARHDPAHVLADIAAKRSVINVFVSKAAEHQSHWSEMWFAKEVLGALAEPYSDRPGYQEATR